RGRVGGRGRAGRSAKRPHRGPVVRPRRPLVHRRYLPGARGYRPERSRRRAEEHLQRRELPVSSGTVPDITPSRSALRDGVFLVLHRTQPSCTTSLSRAPMVRKGFTLVELMIVVAVIGVPGALAIPTYLRFQAKSKQAEVKGNLKAAFPCERAYYQEKSTYTSCNMKIRFAPERGNRYRYTLNTTTRFVETCNTTESRATASGTSLPTDGD